MVDAPDLGSGAVRREGSTPSSGTIQVLEGVPKRPLPDTENESRCGKDDQGQLENTAEVESVPRVGIIVFLIGKFGVRNKKRFAQPAEIVVNRDHHAYNHGGEREVKLCLERDYEE